MPQVYAKVNRARPAVFTENAQAQARAARYAEQYVQPIGTAKHSLCEEGSYFSAVNPTPGTGIAAAITAAFSATAGAFLIRNSGVGGEYLYPDYVRLIPTVAPASATRSELVIALDSTTRWSSGGSVLTAVNRNLGSANASVAVVRTGALVLAAESGAVRRISRAQVGTTIPIAFEEILLTFGQDSAGPATLGSAVGLRKHVPLGPCVIANGHDLIVHLWHPGNAVTGATYEVEAGWWER